MKAKYNANDPNPPLREESRYRVLQYFSLYDANKYDTDWVTFLEKQNIKHMFDLIGSRSKLATLSQQKLWKQITHYRSRLRKDPEYCKKKLNT